MSMRTKWLQANRDEEGSLVVALLVLLVVLTLAVGVTARSLGDLHGVGTQQGYSAALAKANAGLSDAMWQLDQTRQYPTHFCGGPGAGCVPIPGETGVQYGATLNDTDGDLAAEPDQDLDQYYTIDAQGTAAGHTVVVREKASYTGSPYQFAVFGKKSLTLNGTGKNLQFDGLLGSGGALTCNGGGSNGSGQVTFGSGSASGCTTPIAGRGRFSPQDPVATCPAGTTSTALAPCIPSSVIPLPCPSGGNFSGTYTAGVYLCTGNVTFSSQVNVAGVTSDGDYDVATAPAGGGQTAPDFDADDGMQVFVIPPSGTSATLALAGSYDNFNSTDTSAFECGLSGGTNLYAQPASQLQVYMAGAGTVDVGAGSNTTCYSGLIYAPSSSLVVNGGNLYMNGSLIVSSMTVNGNPNLNLHHSKTLPNMAPPIWSVSDYRQVGASTFTLTP